MPALTGPLRGAIVAMNQDRVIGLDGNLPWHYPADLKRFKQRTLGHTILMGRKTWESIGSKPLPNRRNIVISRGGVSEDVECFDSIDNAFAACGDSDLWVIGGGQIYIAAMDRLNLLDITLVPDHVNTEGAVRFPTVDPAVWQLMYQEPLDNDPRLINTVYMRQGAFSTS